MDDYDALFFGGRGRGHGRGRGGRGGNGGESFRGGGSGSGGRGRGGASFGGNNTDGGRGGAGAGRGGRGRGRGRGRGGSVLGGSPTPPYQNGPHPHDRKAIGFNYSVLQRRLEQTSYTSISADLESYRSSAASRQQQQKQQQQQTNESSPSRWSQSRLGRGGTLGSLAQQAHQQARQNAPFNRGNNQQPNRHKPRGYEHIIQDDDLQIGQSTTFQAGRDADDGIARAPRGPDDSVMSVFGRRVNRAQGALSGKPLVFVAATGDWVNGAFVPFDGAKPTEQPKDDAEPEAVKPNPEEELLRAEAVRPQGAGLGYGRARAPPVRAQNAAISRSDQNLDEDERDEFNEKSRAEREQDELLSEQRRQAEELLQELLRGYATAPPNGRPSTEPPKEFDDIPFEDMPFASQHAPLPDADKTELGAIAAPPEQVGVEEDEIILVPAAPAQTEETIEKESDNSAEPSRQETPIADEEMTPLSESVMPSTTVVDEGASQLHTVELPGSAGAPEDLPMSVVVVEEQTIIVTSEPSEEASGTATIATQKTEDKHVEEEEDSEEEATEFDLSAMQSFVRSMDGQTGGRTVDMLDIAIETQLKAEEEWLTEESEDEAVKPETKASAATGSRNSKKKAGHQQDEEDGSDSDDSSSNTEDHASEASSDRRAEALGRQRLIEQTKRRAAKRNGAQLPSTGKKGKAKAEPEFDEDEIDEEGVDLHWGDTDEEEDEEDDDDDEDNSDDDDDGDDSDNSDDDDEEDEDEEDEDEDEDEKVKFGKGSSSKGFSWKKSDEEFMRQLESFADEDDGAVSKKQKKQQAKLFKAISRGEIFLEDPSEALDDDLDDYDAAMLRRKAMKRQKGKQRIFDDDDVWALELQEQWDKDRKKKAAKKAQRQIEREEQANNPFKATHGINLGAGKLKGKAARRAEKRAERSARKESAALGRDHGDVPTRAGKSSTSSSGAGFRAEEHELGRRYANNLVELNEQLIIFMRDAGKMTMSLPPMEKKARARVHELASAYGFISRSVGEGNSRFAIITKRQGNATRSINQRRIDRIVFGALSGGSFGLRPKGASKVKGGAGRGAPSSASRNIEGAQVGFGAEKIGEENIGHKLLRGMGWSEGTGIGVVEGGAEPISATVKTRKGGLGF